MTDDRTELVAELRECAPFGSTEPCVHTRAADLIEQQQAEIERLKTDAIVAGQAALDYEGTITRLQEALRDMVARWRADRAHTYASENGDEYRAYDAATGHRADELERLLEQTND